MKNFDITVGGRSLHLTEDNTRVFLFRDQPYDDMDYFQVDDHTSKETLSVYRNPDVCRYMAGILFRANSIIIPKDSNRNSFYDNHGWQPPVLIRDIPDQYEIDSWIAVEVEKDLHADGTYELEEDD